MKTKKSFFLILSLIIVMLLCGCDKLKFLSDEDDATVVDLNQGTQNQSGNNQEEEPKQEEEQDMGKNEVYRSAEETMTFLLDALNRKDAQVIKDKFSPYAKENISDFDAKIERFVAEFPGCNDYKIKDTFYRRSNYGKITYIMTPSYDFTIDDKTYRMRVIYYTESDSDESKLGWYSIQLYERNNPTYSSSMYTHDVEDAPDILLWDYTKDQ